MEFFPNSSLLATFLVKLRQWVGEGRSGKAFKAATRSKSRRTTTNWGSQVSYFPHFLFPFDLITPDSNGNSMVARGVSRERLMGLTTIVDVEANSFHFWFMSFLDFQNKILDSPLIEAFLDRWAPLLRCTRDGEVICTTPTLSIVEIRPNFINVYFRVSIMFWPWFECFMY